MEMHTKKYASLRSQERIRGRGDRIMKARVIRENIPGRGNNFCKNAP